jgi:ABC-type lipoprotein release transport system permease subunit
VNVANLLLARSAARQSEMAIRLALGATRWHLARQLLIESLVLAAVGGSVALLVAHWGTGLLAAFQPADAYSHFSAHARLPDFAAIQLNVAVLALNFGVALACGVIAGLIPAWTSVRRPLNPALQRFTNGGTGTSHDLAHDPGSVVGRRRRAPGRGGVECGRAFVRRDDDAAADG